MLNIAIIGVGGIGKAHIKTVLKTEDCRICALCDINEAVVKEQAEALGIPYCTNYEDIPELASPDAVIVTLPHYLHCKSAVYFLEKGIHVLMEKPMANTVEECDIMIAAAKANNAKLCIAHPQRFVYANQKVKEIVDSGELGKLFMFTEIRTKDYFVPSRPKWFLNKAQAGGGIVMNFGAHALDKLYYILGESKNVEVWSNIDNVKNDEDIEGHAQFMVKFPSGITGSVTFSGYSDCGYDVIYYFTEGALKVTRSTLLYQYKDGNWDQIDTSIGKEYLVYQLEEFIKYIKGEPSIIPDADFGRDVIKVIEEIYQNN